MSTERPTSVLVVGDVACPATAHLADDGALDVRTSTPRALADRHGAATSTARSTDLVDTDCIVACTDALPTALAVAAGRAGVPVVECACEGGRDADADAETDAETDTDADTETDDVPTHCSARAGDVLLDRIRTAVDDVPLDSANRSRIARLHAGSATLVGLTDHDALFEHVVAVATDVLDYDVGVVFAATDDGFERVAAAPTSAVPEYLDADHGQTAQCHRTGEAIRIDDIDAHPVARSPTREFRSGVCVPFGEAYVFEALSTDRAAYDDRDLELAELLCDHAAQAAARIDAESDLQRREETVTALHRAAPRLIDAADEATLYDLTVDIADRVLSFDRSYLLLADGDGFRLVAGTDDVADRAPNTGILGRTYEAGRSFLVDDARTDATAEPAHETTRSALSVPFGDVGVFQALSTDVAAYDETDLELAELLMSYASASRDRICSEGALRESRRVVERLHTAAADVAAAETEADLFAAAMAAVEDVLDFDKSSILVREGDMLVPARNSADSPPDASRPMHISEGFSGKTLRTGESYRVDRMVTASDAEPMRTDYRSGISVPVGDLGVFQAAAAEEAAFTADDVELAELLMSHVAVSLERVRADADRRDERNRLKALFENIPGAAISYEMVDGAPEVKEVNESFERTFGYEAETVTGESLDDFVVPPERVDDAAAFNDRLERGERIQAEVERLTATGPRHFLMQVIPLEVGTENSRGFAIYSDVTEQRRREEALRRQNERLDQFASVVSHDLRNPLNVATGYLDLSRQSGSDDHFDRVECALDRMDALVTDLLALAREGRDVGETESVDLEAVARRAWDTVATRDAVLRCETDQHVEADADRLLELFENLFRNAVEHGTPAGRSSDDDGGFAAASAPVPERERARGDPAGGGTAQVGREGDGDRTSAAGPDAGRTLEEPILTVTVGERPEGDGFYVADDGRGIDADFDPFEAGVTTSDDGTGFGLSIVRSVAEAHDWSVTVGDSETGGARFDFSF